MFYYLVWVRSSRYHGDEALTYSSVEKLVPGTLVKVPLQKELVMGAIVKATSKPAFATKPIAEALPLSPIPVELFELGEWLQRFYASPLGSVAQQFLPVGFSGKSLQVKKIKPTRISASVLPPLTDEQQAALQIISWPDTYLVHGKTGSGKTRLYIELALRALKTQHSAIILTPEIGLTSQLAQNFAAVFGTQVVVLHSQLTPAERQRAWLQILTGETPLVVIGPRSALFSPLKNVGLIVVDEAHEGAYKQEQQPYYHASRVAAQLAHLSNATLVLGSATPSITDYFMAEQKHKPIIRLAQLAQPQLHAETTFVVVDLKDRSLFPRTAYISQPLATAIRQALERGEQTLIYLNRRGTARLVICENCGWQALCPHCDLPLVYHGDSHQLQCHTCGHKQPAATTCPTCGHTSVTFKSIGTKAIVDELTGLFPQARIQRFDTDNKRVERFEQHYDAVRSGKVDILVGTQLLAKGLDLPKLSTVGVVIADTSLAVPDFSAQERTFQLLTQVLGRIGRGHVGGTAIIQTYNPGQPVLAAAIKDDWHSFYHNELEERRKFLFPPFCYLLKLTCRRATAKSAEQSAGKLKDTIKSTISGVRVDGPAPSFHEKFQNKYQWQLVVKATDRSRLIEVIKLLPKSGWTYDIDPINLL
jgi:primosomal protein N' (replication factor Y)